MKKLRDVYVGIDPFILALIKRIIELEERFYEVDKARFDAEKRLQIVQGEYKNTFENLEQDITKWSGPDFFNLFMRMYETKYGHAYAIGFVNDEYPKSRISVFLNQKNVDKKMYLQYVLYLFNEDPWTLNGSPPDLPRLYNAKMYGIFLDRFRNGKIKERNFDGTFQTITKSKCESLSITGDIEKYLLGSGESEGS